MHGGSELAASESVRCARLLSGILNFPLLRVEAC